MKIKTLFLLTLIAVTAYAGHAVCQVTSKKLAIVDSIGTTAFDADPDCLMFSNLNGVCIDTKNNVFILDADLYTLFKFNADLHLIKSIGRQGGGPLEFYFPSKVSNAAITVLDENDDIYIYDIVAHKGKRIRNDLSDVIGTHHFTSFIFDLCVTNDYIYTVAQNKSKNTLIDMYDREGRYVKSFGEMLVKTPPKERLYSFNNSYITANKYHELLLVNQVNPIVRIFDSKGTLVIENTLDVLSFIENEDIITKIKSNCNVLEFNSRNLRENEMYSYLTRGLCSDGEYFYILMIYENLVKLDRKGNVIAVYELDHGNYVGENNFYAKDISIQNGNISIVTSNGLCLMYELQAED